MSEAALENNTVASEEANPSTNTAPASSPTSSQAAPPQQFFKHVYDFLVVISFSSLQINGETYQDPSQQEFTNGFPWVVIDVHQKRIIDKQRVIISQYRQNEQLQKEGEIFVSTIPSGIHKLDNYYYHNFKRKQFCFVVYDANVSVQETLLKWAAQNEHLLARYYTDRCYDFKDYITSPAANNEIIAMLAKLNPSCNTVNNALQLCEELASITMKLVEQGCLLCNTGNEFMWADASEVQKQARPNYSVNNLNYSNEAQQKPLVQSSVVRLRGLPWSATEKDIQDFFAGFKIAKDGVLIVFNLNGRSTGEAYVRFETPAEAQRAFERNLQHMSYRYIEIFPSDSYHMDYAKNLMTHNLGILGQSTIIRMRGIPFNATVQDIEKFFDKLSVKKVTKAELELKAPFIHPTLKEEQKQPEGENKELLPHIHIVTGADGRPTGDAFVEFADSETVKEALKRNKEKIANRYIELFRSTPSEMNSAKMYSNSFAYGTAPTHVPYGLSTRRHFVNHAQGGQYQQPHHQTSSGTDYVVKLRGLPFDAEEEDIAEFFSGLNIATKGIHLVLSALNKPTGEAFVEFTSAKDVEEALSRDRRKMGSRYIEIFKSSKVTPEEPEHIEMQMNGAPQFVPPPVLIYPPNVMSAWKPPEAQPFLPPQAYFPYASPQQHNNGYPRPPRRQFPPEQRNAYHNNYHHQNGYYNVNRGPQQQAYPPKRTFIQEASVQTQPASSSAPTPAAPSSKPITLSATAKEFIPSGARILKKVQ